MEIVTPLIPSVPPMQEVPPPTQSGSVSKKTLMIVGVVVLVLVAAGLAAILFMRPRPGIKSGVVSTQGMLKENATTTPSTDPNSVSMKWVAPVDGKFAETELPDVFVSLIMSTFDKEYLAYINKDASGKVRTPAEVKQNLEMKAFTIGMVSGGKYDGSTLMMGEWVEGWEMGSTGMNFYYLLNQEKHITVFGKYLLSFSYFSNMDGDSFTKKFHSTDLAEFSKTASVDDEISLAEFEIPNKLADADGHTFTFENLAKTTSELKPVSAARTMEMIAPDTQRKFQMSFDSGMYFSLVRPDGYTVHYRYDIPFDGDQGKEVDWSDGTIMGTSKYATSRSTGCGYSSPDVVTEIPEMVPGGHVTDVKGVTYDFYKPVWAAKDTIKADPSDGLQMTDAQMYYQNYEQRLSWDTTNKTVASYEGFMKMHPMFLWKDPFGRWLRFTNENVQSAAECGKPVIYLYPTVTSSIDVTLAPKGGFTYTEPVYRNGWRVTASPDGTLVNRDDNKMYPYLFWEGLGGTYVSPQDFWVVKKADIHRFLGVTLAKIGLNKKEVTDFEEFWEPKMQAAPYYKIGFHGTRVMNEIAPMTISIQPDTTLRVLMDYSELQKPIVEHPPTLIGTPVRKGFTVIEWGGVLR
ncbi:MAG: hypothetical protein NTX72_01655 [Candidatus Uhrbacteria bacterium]|nr:hypothetical protein [Candidatus Uhrbacteria bacterium]